MVGLIIIPAGNKLRLHEVCVWFMTGVVLEQVACMKIYKDTY